MTTQNSRPTTHDPRRGFILAPVYLLITFLMIAGASFFSRVVSEKWHAERYADGVRAFYLAEAGIDRALQSFIGNAGYAGIGYAALAPIGGFEIQVAQPGGPNFRRVEAVGHVPDSNNAGAGYQQRRLEATVQLSDTLFPYGLFAQDRVTIQGDAMTDSYNSTVGPYNPDSPNSKGDIGTNATGAGSVQLQGEARVNGNAFVGAGGSPSTVISQTGDAAVTGTKTSLDEPITLTAPTVPPGVPNSGDLNLGGSTVLVLPGGTYWYNKIALDGSAQLQFQGPATVYLSGDLTVKGNAAVSGLFQDPAQLSFAMVSAGSGDVNELELTGHSRIFATIDAPLSTFQFGGNAELFGALIAREGTFKGNSRLHYDEALGQGYAGGVPTKSWVVSWREIHNP